MDTNSKGEGKGDIDMCINCQEYNSVVFHCGIGVCRDPECLFIPNPKNPYICTICNKDLHKDILHIHFSTNISFNDNDNICG